MPVCCRAWLGSRATSKPWICARSTSGHHERRKDAEESRLAAPIGPEQAEDLRRLDGEAQVVERQPVAVTMREAVELNGHLLLGIAGRDLCRGMLT